LGLSVSFAAIDWVMSLEPDWFSTIFGALIGAGHLLSAMAFAVAVATLVLAPTALFSPVSQTRVDTAAARVCDAGPNDAFNDLGSLLLAFVMVWTYMAFSQYLLIWSGNLDEEITWYLHRIEGGWQWIGLSLAAGYFALPFCLLLSRNLKRDPARLRMVALLVVGIGMVNNYWLIAPAFSPSRLYVHWLDFAAFVAVGGLWLACFLWQLQARPIMPAHEMSAAEELHHA
jgi:hypothetical protein